MSIEMLDLPEGISVVVPVFNSEGTLTQLAVLLEEVLCSCTRRFELILVNDCSRDNSWKVICDLSDQFDWVRGINLMRNYGQHNALLCGIRAAAYDTIVTIDDDLQNPPGEIPRLLSVLQQGYDVVYGYPEKQQHGLLRDLASEITKSWFYKRPWARRPPGASVPSACFGPSFGKPFLVTKARSSPSTCC